MIEIVQLLLGNRRANPYPYFSGRTNFNADLAGAELLAVDDEAGSTDIRSRRTFATSLKSCLFSGSVRIEGKNRTAFTFRPCWRMMLALNDEPEALLVLPLTEDIVDKIILFQCQRVTLPMPAHTTERERFFAALQTEVPTFLLRKERCFHETSKDELPHHSILKPRGARAQSSGGRRPCCGCRSGTGFTGGLTRRRC